MTRSPGSIVYLFVTLALLTHCGPKEEAPAGQKAPPVFRAKLETSKGNVLIEVHRDWAPRGADRFYELVKSGFYDQARFFRVLPGFMAQFGLSADPAQNQKWNEIADDSPGQSNRPGMVSFATRGPNSRTTQLFINTADNSSSLDPQGFTPFGRVIEGMSSVIQLYSDYGEGAPQGTGPDQGRIRSEGNAYLTREFPNLDYIKRASIVE